PRVREGHRVGAFTAAAGRGSVRRDGRRQGPGRGRAGLGDRAGDAGGDDVAGARGVVAGGRKSVEQGGVHAGAGDGEAERGARSGDWYREVLDDVYVTEVAGVGEGDRVGALTAAAGRGAGLRHSLRQVPAGRGAGLGDRAGDTGGDDVAGARGVVA